MRKYISARGYLNHVAHMLTVAQIVVEINLGLEVLYSMVKMLPRRGNSADTSNSDVQSLAADSTSSEVAPFVMGCYSLGLTTDHVFNTHGPNRFLYTFTENLIEDLKQALQIHWIEALFLCELGDMKEPGKIDAMFRKRFERNRLGTEACNLPPICDACQSLKDYLHAVCARVGFSDWNIYCSAPYACIWDSTIMQSLQEPIRFYPSPTNLQRIAMSYKFMHLPANLDFAVVCIS